MTNLLWQRLTRQLTEKVDAFPGVAGIALQELGEGLTLGINADELFPTASTIKIHILTKLFQRAEAGEVELDARISIDAADYVAGSGVITHLNGPVVFSLRDLATLMIIASDNTATNLCIEQAGIAGTNELLQAMGLRQTRLQRKMMDSCAALREEENISTPAELVTMLALLRRGEPSAAVAEQVLSVLQKPKRGFIPRGVPATVMVANKPGWIDAAMCDAALVYLPRRPYLLAVMSNYALCDAVAQEHFITDISATVYATMATLDKSSGYGRVLYP